VVLESIHKDSRTIEWVDKQQSQRCCEFLFDEFKRFYLIHMFPNAFSNPPTNRSYSSYYNIYGNINLLTQLNEIPQFEKIMPNEDKKLAQLNCKEEIIRWLTSTLLIENDKDTIFMYESDTL
jgi:hypothetical protein